MSATMPDPEVSGQCRWHPHESQPPLIYAHHGDRFAPLPELLAEIFFHFSIQLSDLDGLRRPIGTAYLASEYFSERAA
jgi:hypothetical protein